MENKTLNGKNVVISGGNKGIGLSLSKKLVENGANVISLSRTLIEIDELKNKKYTQIQCDITNYNDLKSNVEKIKADFGKVEILINNAGIIDFKPFADSEVDSAHKMISTNMISAIDLVHLVLQDMIKSEFGIILNISSVGAIYNYPNCSVYNASKAGLLSFSRSLRSEVRKFGIKIIDILPGATDTEIWDAKIREKHHTKMMTADALADIIIDSLIHSISNKLMIEEIIITPQLGSL
jgi:3-oxoacyl-[acyl-carrier protein] reductase